VKTIPLFKSILICLASIALVAQAHAKAIGNIKILEVKGGSASVTMPDGSSTPATAGEFIQQGATVKTGSGSSVSLLFDNGALIVVEPKSELSVDEFTTDPFNYEGIDYKTLSKEPSKSVTKLMVKDGLIGVDVVSLNSQSKFEIATPVGTAGVRGTRFGVSFNSATNRANVVVVIGSVSVSSPRGQMQVVSAGMGIGIGPAGIQALAQQVVAALAQQISQIIQALRPTVPTNPFAGSPPQTSTGDGGDQTDDTGDQGTIDAGQTLPNSGTGASQ